MLRRKYGPNEPETVMNLAKRGVAVRLCDTHPLCVIYAFAIYHFMSKYSPLPDEALFCGGI